MENKKVIMSRGIPSEERLYFPPYNSKEIRSFEDNEENLTRNLWSIEEVLNFIFPKKYQSRYYEVALGFIKLLGEKLELKGSEISEYVKSNGISKATFYNKVLPRLKRAGMIKVERETIVALENKRKFRPMKIKLSKTFGNYLIKIGDSWLGFIDDARSRKKIQI